MKKFLVKQAFILDRKERSTGMIGFGAKSAIAIMVTLFLCGCAYSLSEIRASKPDYTLTSTKSPQMLAKCIELKMRATLSITDFVVALEEHPNNTYCVVITFPLHSYVVDILVKPTDSGSVIEFRKRGWWAQKAEMIEIARRCAQ